jgi:hypothetical protein
MSETTITTTINAQQPVRPEYPIGVPHKFSPDGRVQRYAGNTTLCHVPTDSPLLCILQAFHNRLGSHPMLSKLIHLLPPSSWHMTIFDCMRETECEPGMWPSGMLKVPLAESTVLYRERLHRLGLELDKEGLAPPYQMRVCGIDGAAAGIGLELEGATPDEEARMRKLRDRISVVLGIRAPNHEVYGFHISVAYFLRHVVGEARDELHRIFMEFLPVLKRDLVTLGSVEFCTFENMQAFHRLMYLSDSGDGHRL